MTPRSKQTCSDNTCSASVNGWNRFVLKLIVFNKTVSNNFFKTQQHENLNKNVQLMLFPSSRHKIKRDELVCHKNHQPITFSTLSSFTLLSTVTAKPSNIHFLLNFYKNRVSQNWNRKDIFLGSEETKNCCNISILKRQLLVQYYVIFYFIIELSFLLYGLCFWRE